MYVVENQHINWFIGVKRIKQCYTIKQGEAMLEKYFNGIISLVYDKMKKEEKNIAMVCYNNEFSLSNLEKIRRYSKESNVYFCWKEYAKTSIVGAYDPFLDLICTMFREYGKEDWNKFLDRCEVYEPHREILSSYMEKGICQRTEKVLLDEVSYEQKRLTRTLCLMLQALAEYKPIMVVINRMEFASPSTFQLINQLLNLNSNKIGIVLGINIIHKNEEDVSDHFKELMSKLEELQKISRVGSDVIIKEESNAQIPLEDRIYPGIYQQLQNMVAFLDYEQCDYYLNQMVYRMNFEQVMIPAYYKKVFGFLHIHVSIYLKNLSRALQILEEIRYGCVEELDPNTKYYYLYYRGLCYLYQGKKQEARLYAKRARAVAVELKDDFSIFKIDAMLVTIQMADCYAFNLQSKPFVIEEQLIEKFKKYNFINLLAHVYIYAFDNDPEKIRKSYLKEGKLAFFDLGIELAKQLDNQKLLSDAYQKIVVIASLHGMNEIALWYSFHSFQFLMDDDLAMKGKVYSDIGYHLSAIGKHVDAIRFYEHAIWIFYQLQKPEEVAAICYNYALTQICEGNDELADKYLQLAINTVETLRLDSLRFCELSELYALKSIVSTLLKNLLNSERYMLNCRQFLDYALDQEKQNKADKADNYSGLCLYYLSKSLLEIARNDLIRGRVHVERATEYFNKVKDNLFFIEELLYETRTEVYLKLGQLQAYLQEKKVLFSYRKEENSATPRISRSILNQVLNIVPQDVSVSVELLETLVKKKNLEQITIRKKQQMDFLYNWQNLLDAKYDNVASLIENTMRVFLNYFNNDGAVYLRYDEGKPQILYNSTGTIIGKDAIEKIENNMKRYPQGFVASKLNNAFLEYDDVLDMLSIFGSKEIYSLVIVPFVKKGKNISCLITYVKAKSNWNGNHSYMLSDEDIQLYRLLFVELGHTIKRHELNDSLKRAATTDILTSTYNRAGMYARLKEMRDYYVKRNIQKKLGIMFLDLDNFKPYNDAYGHDVGDLVLKLMTNIFKEVTKEYGFVVRYGGDEFIIITETDDILVLEKLVQTIFLRIEEANGFEEEIKEMLKENIHIDQYRKVSCSVGIATGVLSDDASDIEETIAKADELLYKVKSTNKGSYLFI